MLTSRYFPYQQLSSDQKKFLNAATGGRLLTPPMPLLLPLVGEVNEFIVSPSWLVCRIRLDELGPTNSAYIKNFVFTVCFDRVDSIDCFAILDCKLRVLLLILETCMRKYILKTREDLESPANEDRFDLADFEFHLSQQYVVDTRSTARWAVLNSDIWEMKTLIDHATAQYNTCLRVYPIDLSDVNKVGKLRMYNNLLNNNIIRAYITLSSKLPPGWKFLPIFRGAMQELGVSLIQMNFEDRDRFPIDAVDIVKFLGTKLNKLCDSIIDDHADITDIDKYTNHQLVNRHEMFREYDRMRFYVYKQFGSVVTSTLDLPIIDVTCLHQTDGAPCPECGPTKQKQWTEFRLNIVIANVHRTTRLVCINQTYQFGYIISKTC